jgi:hypothetical protein
VIGDKIIVDAVVHPDHLEPSDAHDEFSRACAQGVPAPWSALRGTALAPPA